MERDSNLSQEHFPIPPRQALLGNLFDFCQKVAHKQTRFCVDPREGEVVILGFKVEFLLFREQYREVRYDTCHEQTSARRIRKALNETIKVVFLTIGHALYDRVDFALDSDTDMIAKDGHLPSYRDRSSSERYERSRYVPLPQLHDHVCRFEDRQDRE